MIGGFPTNPEWLAIWVAIIVIQTLAIGGGGILGERMAEQSEQRRLAVARLETALEENAGLHAQLLTQAREAGVLDERQRMAGEIHDTIAQGLTGIVTQLEAAEQARDRPEAWQRHVRNAIGLARESLSEARRSVEGSRPEHLETARLPEALADVAREWSELNGVPVEVVTTGDVQPLHPEVEVALLRTAQEALANVAKHANASRAGLTLSYMGDVVTLDVRDDGVGFEVLDRVRRAWGRLRAVGDAAARQPGGRDARHRVRARRRDGGLGAGPRDRRARPGRPRMTPIRLLIVDDHPVVRDGLRGMFSGDPEFEVVGEASDGAEAIDLAGRLVPDVILMDLRMPGVNGAAAIRAIAERQIPSRVLVLTTYDSDSDVVPAIEAGATGYLLKDSPRDELFRAVRAASRGESVLASSVANAADEPAPEPGLGGAQRPRARGAVAHRPGRDEPRGGRAAVHLRGDRQDAPGPHLLEAERQRPGRRRRDGLRARAAAYQSGHLTRRPRIRSPFRACRSVRLAAWVRDGWSVEDSASRWLPACS